MARSEQGKPIKPSFVNFNKWMKYTADERDVICDMTEADYKRDILNGGDGVSVAPEPTPGATEPATTPPPKDVADWAKAIAAKVDKAFHDDMREGVNLKKKVTHKVLDYVAHIDRLQIILPRWDSVKPAGSNAPDTDFDVYLEPKSNKKGKALDPVRRHRVNDAFDASFPEYVTPLRTLKDMGKDDIKAMGANTHSEKLADASKEYNDAKNYFSDAAEVYSIWKAVNGVPGVRVAPHLKGDGSIEHKAFPWRLQDVILNDDGTVKDVRDGCNISTRDLQGYRPEVVNEMMQQKDEKGAPKWPSTYKALLNSQKPRVKRKAQGATTGPTQQARQTAVKNINDYESAAADIAVLVEEPGFSAEWLKLVNDPDQKTGDAFLHSDWIHYKFLDRKFGMNDGQLAKRAGAIADKLASEADERRKTGEAEKEKRNAQDAAAGRKTAA